MQSIESAHEGRERLARPGEHRTIETHELEPLEQRQHRRAPTGELSVCERAHDTKPVEDTQALDADDLAADGPRDT